MPHTHFPSAPRPHCHCPGAFGASLRAALAALCVVAAASAPRAAQAQADALGAVHSAASQPQRLAQHYRPRPPGLRPGVPSAPSAEESAPKAKPAAPLGWRELHRPAAPIAKPHAAAAPADDVEVIEATDVAQAPSGPATWWGDSWPAWDRIVDAMTARTVRKRTFGTLISHRNYMGFTQKPLHSLFGFDGGLLKVGLGLRYGILDNLDVGVQRVNGTSEVFNTFEFDARYNLLSQQKFGVDLALRVGFSWFEQYHHADAIGALAQLLIDRVLFNRVMVGGGFLFHSSSSGAKKANTDPKVSAAVQLYADWRIYDGMSLAAELTQPVAGYHLHAPVFTVGPRFITNRHTFSVVLSNSQYTSADGIITGTDRSFGNWVLGFNITREL